MQKEVLLAIVFGSLLGLVIAFGVWKVNIAMKQDNTVSPAAQEEQKDNPIVTHLTIAKPDDKHVTSNNIVLVSGVAIPNAYVIVSGEETDYFTKTTSTGEFEVEVLLIGGINQLRIFSLNPEGATETKDLLVVYSTELSKESKDLSEASDEASIEKVIQEKITQAGFKAYIGTITDITEGSIQIRSDEGEIKQVSSNDQTTYANIVKATKEIQLKDLAIGDYVVVIGSTNGKEVVSAKRLLVTTTIKAPNRKAYQGSVVKTGKKDLTLNNNGSEVLFDTTRKGLVVNTLSSSGEILKSRLTNIKESSKLIVIALEESPISARTIHIIPE
jgi:hypothetical protein